MRRVFLAVSAVALLSACGSGKSCSDACNAVYNCAVSQGIGASLGPTFVSTCVQACNATTCSNKQQVIDCVAGAKCDATLSNYLACDPGQTCF